MVITLLGYHWFLLFRSHSKSKKKLNKYDQSLWVKETVHDHDTTYAFGLSVTGLAHASLIYVYEFCFMPFQVPSIFM